MSNPISSLFKTEKGINTNQKVHIQLGKIESNSVCDSEQFSLVDSPKLKKNTCRATFATLEKPIFDDQKHSSPRKLFISKSKVKFGQQPHLNKQLQSNNEPLLKPVPSKKVTSDDDFNSACRSLSPQSNWENGKFIVPAKSATPELGDYSLETPLKQIVQVNNGNVAISPLSTEEAVVHKDVTPISSCSKSIEGESKRTRPLTIGRRGLTSQEIQSNADILTHCSRRNAVTLKPITITPTTFSSQNYLIKDHFTIDTPLTNEFKPIQPIDWISNNLEPSRQQIAQNKDLYDDIHKFVNDKELWKKEGVLSHLPFYAKAKQIGILSCTWNVNQCVFTREEVDEWTSGIKYKPDIVICGLQELDMSFDAIITGKKFSEKSIQWDDLIFQSINRGSVRYEKLGYYQLCGVVLYVFFNVEIQNFIGEVGFQDIRVGAMSGKLANKGGVAYRMKIFDSTLCFVVSHLAAHQEFWDKRNEDWGEISKMKITYFDSNSCCSKKIDLLQHDVIVWMGDLNYRIEMSDSEVREHMKKKNYAELAKSDQLLDSMKKKKVFQNFNEATLNFGPTFKIKIRENNEYKENRIPSWCDRVLWKTENKHFVEAKEYTSHELYTSDHKPVSCFMSVDLQVIDKNKKGQVEEYLEETKNKYLNIIIPNVCVEPSVITVDGIELLKHYNAIVTLKNIGKFDTNYEIENSVGCEYQEDWLTIKQSKGTVSILPGKELTEIPIDIYINQSQAWMYQDRNMLLKKITILLGDDHQTKISFSVIVKTPVSIIGMRLESLNRLARPLIGKPNPLITYSSMPFLIPKEFHRLTDYVINNYKLSCFVETRPLLYTSEQMRSLIYSLNTESSLPDGPIQLFCDAILLFLSGLHECCTYYNLTDNCSNLNDQYICKVIRFVIPDEYRHLFVYLISFLKKLMELGEDKVTLVTRFTPHVFRCYNPTKTSPYIRFLTSTLGNPLSFLTE